MSANNAAAQNTVIEGSDYTEALNFSSTQRVLHCSKVYDVNDQQLPIAVFSVLVRMVESSKHFDAVPLVGLTRHYSQTDGFGEPVRLQSSH